MKNLKDTITTIAGLLMAICTPLMGAGIAEYLPKEVTIVCAIIVGVCGGLIGYFNGKKANGKKKDPEQINANNTGKVIWQHKSGIDTTKVGPAGDAAPGTGINPPPST